MASKEKAKKGNPFWWVFLIIGFAAIALSIWFMCNPVASLITMIVFIEIFFIVGGAWGIITSISRRKELPAWVACLILNIFVVFIGLLFIFYPGGMAAAGALLYVLTGASLIAMGVFVIIKSTMLKSMGAPGWGGTLALGIIITAAAVFIAISPWAVAVFLCISFAVGVLFFGIYCITMGFQLKDCPPQTN